jgi:hypothetical protein
MNGWLVLIALLLLADAAFVARAADRALGLW